MLKSLRAVTAHRAGSSVPLICGGDCNGRFGSVLSSAVGSFAADIEDEDGELIHAWLLENDLCLPSTFPQFASPITGTWTNGSGGRAHRIDFVAVQRSLVPHVKQQCVVPDFVVLCRKPDHLPVLVSLSIDKTADVVAKTRRTLPYDLKLLSEPDRAQNVTTILESFPLIPFGVDPDIQQFLL